MNVTTFIDRIEYLEGQSVHMCHRKDADNVISRVDKRKVVGRKLGITPQTAIGEHDAFRGAGGTRSVIQQA